MAAPITANQVNVARVAAGLPALAHSPALTKAADAHAHYLARNLPMNGSSQVSAHEEQSGAVGYSGEFAPERAQAFAYPHGQVLENISIGNESVDDSAGDLMSAIYHRFAFLDFDIDEMGAAATQQRYVYELGIQNLAQTCSNQAGAASLTQKYDCLGKVISKANYQQLCTDLPDAAQFSPPYQNRCENGALLNAPYMQSVCQSPPSEAILKGAGRYFDACGDGTRISAKWFNQQCESNREDIIYQHTGATYKICSPEREVNADWYEGYCASLPLDSVQESGRYYNVCANGFKIKSEYYAALGAQRLAMRPEVVLWPANEVAGISPVFYDEDPHPTPDLPMTGYPISIQFNPHKVSSVAIMGFQLEHFEPQSQQWQAVTGIRAINELNDVQKKFSALQFAWFPLHRLQWNSQYHYRIDALVDGGFRQFSATFKTVDLNLPLYEVQGGIEELEVSAKHFVLYRQPDAYDTFPFRDVNLQYKSNARVAAKVIDSSTVELEISGRGCSPFYLNTRLNEGLKVHHCPKNIWRDVFQ
ncbi:MAG: CAP domain-containing protein [Arenicellales bacterium]